MHRFFRRVVFTVLCAFGLAAAHAKPPLPFAAPKDTLYQYSTLDALLAGVFDGALTIGEAKQHGDTGIGTINGVNGELLFLHGVAYQITSDGKVHIVPDTTKTPLVFINRFVADQRIIKHGPMTKADFETWLNAQLPLGNRMFALRITGVWTTLKTRSYPQQTRKPYPPLATLTQNVFDFANVRGTMVGYKLPPYLAGLNVAGCHLHFLNQAKTAGGHVLDYDIRDVVVEVDEMTHFEMQIPASGDFHTISADKNRAADRDKVEQGKK